MNQTSNLFFGKQMHSISIIVPTLNEEAQIDSLLKHLKTIARRAEILVIDADSDDETCSIAAEYARVCASQRGRAVQMNRGAALAEGEILWFVHADCRPHAKSVDAILSVLKDPEVVGGAFEWILDAPGLYFRSVEFFSNWKNRIGKLVCGDMGIFVRKSVFEKMNGYAEIPLMEDMDFGKRLKREGKIVILPFRIITSARRWYDEGILKNVTRNWMLQILWSFGVSPETLKKWYRFK